MRSSLLILLLSFLIAGLTAEFSNAQNNSSLSEGQVEEIIRSNFEQMAEAMQDGNAAKVASYFTEDAFFKLPGQEPGKGREAIQNIHEGMISQGLGIRPSTEEVQVFGNHALELGTVDILGPDGNVANQAYYLTLWEDVDGEWKISRDVVSSLPPSQE